MGRAYLAALPALIAGRALAGDVLITLGAGSIGDLPKKIVALLDATVGAAQ